MDVKLINAAMQYIENELPVKILKTNENLKHHKFVKCTANSISQLDGFMSNIYLVELITKCETTQSDTVHNLIVKLMKDGVDFRKATSSDIQFSNEIYVYSNVLPYYKKILQDTSKLIKIENWIPNVYFAYYGKIPGYSNEIESVLALEYLKPKGYRNGPLPELDEKHLRLMIKILAEYHAMTYVLRIKNDPNLVKLINGIQRLHFIDPNGKRNFYNVLYDVGFKRFFEYFDRIAPTEEICTKDFVQIVNKLRDKYGKNPVELLNYLGSIDDQYSVIQHGDFNRNNALFQYDRVEGYDNPMDAKLIDFQEIRYGSPAMDLSFLMYLNGERNLRNEIWHKLLSFYHDTLINTIMEVLQCSKDADILKPYSFENFNKHFSKYAFYGAMVCIHFKPWMFCNVDELSKLSYLFENDLYGEEFQKISLSAGGDKVNFLVLDVIRHAFDNGYMKIFE